MSTFPPQNVSSDAKERAQERLDNEDFGTSTELDAETTDHQKNPGNVIGGLKAALKVSRWFHVY